MAPALVELSVRCRPPHRQTAGRREENESHPGGILPTGHLPKGRLPRGHSGDGPLEGSSCRPKGRTGTAAHVEGERVCKGPVGGGPVQGTAGWVPTLEGQAAPTLWVTGRGSQVVGHSEELCLCSVSRGNPGRAVGRGGAGSDLSAGFYEDESQRNRSGCRWANWRQLQWPTREGTVVLIRLVQSRLGRRRILGLFGEVIAWPGLHG